MKKTIALSAAIGSIALMAATLDLNQLDNYTTQTRPAYIQKDNTPGNNPITDKGATLGRVLFYDKNLSANNSISCGSCHKQQFAFGDTAVQSRGLSGGLTDRHTMRLVNARFGNEAKFFWDERAASLEIQTTQPIQNHVEMGFSGDNGDPDLDSLIRKLEEIDYYQTLFTFVYGDAQITENRIQRALAQFVRSIQSFDAKYDIGRAQVPNDAAPFPNFTQQENMGKGLFLAPPPNGAGCQGCHQAPEFDIDPNALNNNVIGVAGNPGLIDLTNTRAPSLRDVVNPGGSLNGPLMHDGSLLGLPALIDHYNLIALNAANTNLDPRLVGPNNQGQSLQLNPTQKDALVAFLRTLTGSNIYTDPKWSNPFDANGNLTLIPATSSVDETQELEIRLFPNPSLGYVTIDVPAGNYRIEIYDAAGRRLRAETVYPQQTLDLTGLPDGLLLFRVSNTDIRQEIVKKIIKNHL